MNKLAKQRLSQNFKRSLKYLTLVFNDFFILALIFLFGALMFWYAKTLKTMPNNLWFYKPLTAFVLWLPFLAGRLVTLFKAADLQFLFSQDGEAIEQYLKPMISYSMILPTILIVLMGGILYPFAILKADLSLWQYLAMPVSLILYKYAQLLHEKVGLNFEKTYSSSIFNAIILALMLLEVYFMPSALVAVGLIALGASKKITTFNWNLAIENERVRKDRIYSLFSMFTDVEEKQVVIKRRKYLDFLLPKTFARDTPNSFIYRRSLLRNPEYLNLLVRMTIFAVLVSWLTANWRWACGLSCLIVFLTAYQLLPLAKEFDNNIMYRIAPIDYSTKGNDLVKVLDSVLLLQWLCISISWLLILPINFDLSIASSTLLVMCFLLGHFYLPNKIKG